MSSIFFTVNSDITIFYHFQHYTNLHMFLYILPSMFQYIHNCNILDKWIGNLTNKSQNIPNHILQPQMLLLLQEH